MQYFDSFLPHNDTFFALCMYIPTNTQVPADMDKKLSGD